MRKGGKREGSGRKKTDRTPVLFRADKDVLELIQSATNKSDYINGAIREYEIKKAGTRNTDLKSK